MSNHKPEMDKIKLVIWDLDETFWEGTLSEGSIIPIEKNIELVKELTNKGIINSIVSKNNFDQAKTKLEELGVWDYFVFPSISWSPKGQLIAELIEKAQLRAPNVLFIDDNHSNIKEAQYYNSGLHAEFPDFIDSISEHPAFKGKDDSTHSRLKQYKVLEKKHIESKNFSSNEEFLKSSEIRIHYVKNLLDEEDRIYELLERTNQLNFTKIRLNKEDTAALLKSDKYEQRAISVSDLYGDYGVVGYLCYSKADHQLIHFVFSCRILNLGIEQYLYAELGFPHISVIPEVAIELNKFEHPNWINEVAEVDGPTEQNNSNKKRILFKGGCDLGQMLHYLNQYNFDFINETNYVGSNNIPIHAEHTEILLDSKRLDNDSKTFLASKIPFLDSHTYKSQVLDGNYDVLIYSVLMDFTQDLYQHNSSSIKVPYGGYSYSLTNKDDWPIIISSHVEKNRKDIDHEFLDFFYENFKNIGQISPVAFKENLKVLRKQVPTTIPIIFINGAELDSTATNETDARKRHEEMNLALDEFIATSNNCYLLDVRRVVAKQEDLTDNIRHFKRTKYKNLSENLLEILDTKIDLKIETNFFSKNAVLGVVSRVRHFLWQFPFVRFIKRKLIS